MCLLCDDETAYRAYMDYLDAVERKGQSVDPDKAMDAVLDTIQAADKASSLRRDAPENDKTLSPFFCSPVDRANSDDKVMGIRRFNKPDPKML